MLRRRTDAPAPRDSIDEELLEAVDEGVPWKGLLRSASCPPEEAEGRLLRLIALGYLEGEPYDNTRPPQRPVDLEPEHHEVELPDVGIPRRSTVPDSAPRAASPAIPPPAASGRPIPAQAHAAGESLLRELARRSGVSFAPVAGPADARARTSAPPAAPSEPARSHVSARPSHAPTYSSPSSSGSPVGTPVAHASSTSMAPSSSAPPQRASSVSLPPAGSSAPPSVTGMRPVAMTSDPSSQSSGSFAPVANPYGSHSSSAPPAATSRPPSDGAYAGVDSPLLHLIHELAGGPGMQRWTAARLREALHEELAGSYTQAVSILQVVMAQVEDPRIRGERDRIQAKLMQANSGVFRKQAIEAERGLRHNEAAEAWRKVLEAQPNDADAALHAAMCYMEAGNLKQAGALARRAVELAPASVNAHRILYRFFRKTGMEASAKRESEILAKLKKA